jgi:integrase
VPRLTDATIRSQAPNTILWDSDLRGFGCRAGKSSKTFVVLVASGRRHKLGRYPTLSLAQARQKAKDKLAEIQLGADHRTIAFKELQARFLADRLGNVRDRTYESYTWLLGRIQLKGNAADITTRQITEATTDLAPSVKHHILAVLKMVFRYGIQNGLVKQNPAEHMTVRKSKSRSRVLTDDELKKVWHVCPGTAFGTVVKLLILTGQRRSEIEHISLDGDLATIPREYVKNDRPHTFPVGKTVQQLLAEPRTWGGWSKSKSDLDKASGVTNWTLHDLRRTFVTNMARIGTPLPVIERYINHVSGSFGGVVGVYQRHDYMDEMRDAAHRYEAHLQTLLTTPPT